MGLAWFSVQTGLTLVSFERKSVVTGRKGERSVSRNEGGGMGIRVFSMIDVGDANDGVERETYRE
jgi:hypothetical protein